jgi:hypothetical protein
MKFAISTAALLLVLGTTAPIHARQEKGQEEHHEEAKPASQGAKPAQHQETAKPAQHEPQAKAEHTQQPKAAEQHPAHTQAQTHTQAQQHPVTHAQANDGGRTQARPAQSRSAQSRSAARGNYAHGRISDSHYAASFGAEHRFHVSQGDYEHRRFQYGGYSFGFVDPWPVGWGYSDDVYVMYVDGGYYMYDPVHEGVRISINIM